MADRQTLTIEINGNTVALEKSLKSINDSISYSKQEARSLQSELKFDPGNAELLTKRQKALADALELSKEKAKILKDDLANIDPQVDPKAFFQLSKKLSQAERDTRSFQRQLDVTEAILTRSANKAQAFKFDPGTGIREFQNSIAGVEAALSTLGNTGDLLKFEASEKSLEEVRGEFSKIQSAMELLEKKAKLLDDELDHVDVKVDPEGFTKIQNQITAVKKTAEALENQKTKLAVVLGDEVTPKAPGIISSMRAIFSESSSVSDGIKNIAKTGISSISEFFSKSPREILSTVTSSAAAGLTGLTKIGRKIPESLNELGDTAEVKRSLASKVTGAISGAAGAGVRVAGSAFRAVGTTAEKALVASLVGIKGAVTSAVDTAVLGPFRAVGSGIGTIIRGGLLTVGQNITNTIGSTVSGAVKSMEETQVAAKSLENVLSFAGVDTGTIEKLKKDMADYAKTTTFGASELDQVVAGLSAAGIEAEKTGELTKNIANAYALLGNGTRKISDIGNIFTQINQATKLTAQDFNQLRDAGLGGAIKKEVEAAFPDIIAQYGSFSEAMSKSAISAEMVNQAVANIGNSKAANDAAKVPKTMSAAFDTLEETLGQKFQGLYSQLSANGINAITGLTDFIDNMDLGPIVNSISAVISKAHEIGSAVGDSLKSIDISAFLPVLGKLSDGLISTFTKASGAIGDVLASIGSTISGDAFKSTLSNVGTFLNQVVGAVGDFVKSGALTEGLSFILGMLRDISSGVVSVFGTIIDTVKSSGLVENLAGPFQNITASMKEGWEGMLAVINSSALKDVFKITFGALVDVIGPVSEALSELSGFFGSLWNKLGEAANGSGASAIVGIFEGLRGIVQNVMGVFSQLKETVFSLFSDETIDPLLGILGKITEGFAAWFDTVKNFVDGVFSGFREGFQWLNESGTFDNLGKALSDLNTAMAPLVEVFKQFAEFLKPVYEFVGSIIGKLLGFAVSAAFKLLIDGISLLVKFISEIVQKVTEFASFIGGLGDSIVKTISNVLGFGSSGSSYANYASYASYATYAGSSSYSTTNHVAVHVNGGNFNPQELARAIRHEYAQGTA